MRVEELKVRGLGCQRGGQLIVSNLSFEVHAGRALVLHGPNGSGKTTLLRTLAGYLPAASGEIEVRPGPGLEGLFHYFGHTNGVKPRLSVIENALFWQSFYGEPRSIDRVEEALDAFGLLHLADYRAAHLSQGQGRRLGLARLLVAKRPIWLLDEPSVSLDRASTTLLEGALAAHQARGGIAVIATHLDLAVVSETLTLGAENALQ